MLEDSKSKKYKAFVAEVLAQCDYDVNTQDAKEVVIQLAEQLDNLYARDLFNMPESRAKYYTKLIQFYEYTLSQYIAKLNYIDTLKSSITEKEKCISTLYRGIQERDLIIRELENRNQENERMYELYYGIATRVIEDRIQTKLN